MTKERIDQSKGNNRKWGLNIRPPKVVHFSKSEVKFNSEKK